MLKVIKRFTESLSSIILNCPRCNITKTVFSTTLGNITCKECNVNMSYVCNKCNLRYPTMLALYRHKKLQCETTVKTKILRKFISVTLSYYVLWLLCYSTKHLYILRFSEPKTMFILKCTKCDLSQKIQRLKVSRCLTCRIDMPYECMVCGKTFNTYSNLYSHMKRRCQPKRRTYYCNECSFNCTCESILVRHLNKHHPGLFVLDITVKCCVCDQTFKDGTHLKRHESGCGASFYQCRYCTFKPKYQENLKKHLLTRHTEKVRGQDIQDVLRQSVNLPKIFNQQPEKGMYFLLTAIVCYFSIICSYILQ